MSECYKKQFSMHCFVVFGLMTARNCNCYCCPHTKTFEINQKAYISYENYQQYGESKVSAYNHSVCHAMVVLVYYFTDTTFGIQDFTETFQTEHAYTSMPITDNRQDSHESPTNLAKFQSKFLTYTIDDTFIMLKNI